MSVLLDERQQVLETAFPLDGKGIPYEPKCIQPRPAVRGHRVPVRSLAIDPLSKSVTIGSLMPLWDSTISVQSHELQKILKTFFPLFPERIPLETKRI